MKLAWVSDWNAWGNGKGYSIHNGNMKKQAIRLGAEMVSPEECDIALDIVVPQTYEPVPGKFNVLFTMYEMDRIPPEWIPKVQQADLIIVPCRHNKPIFERHVKCPVEVCQEGFDPEEWPYVERKFPQKPNYFNFLWVGASNPRKGYEFVTGAWELWLTSQPADVVRRSRLIMKTTKAQDDESVKSMYNCIIDNRKLPFAELKKIYYASHAFLLPSLGEGWGLTLHEAQGSGLPCIYTPWSGPNDFMSKEDAYPVKWKFGKMSAVRPDETGELKVSHTGLVAKPDMESIVRRMEQIYYGYTDATRRAKRSAMKLHKHFTWNRAGEIMMDILERRYKEWKETNNGR